MKQSNEKPWYIKQLVYENPKNVLFFAIPLSVLFFWLGYDANRALQNTLGLMGIGILYWTFLEYAVHRWVYHFYVGIQKNIFWRTFKKFNQTIHLYHHQNMHDSEVLNAGPILAIFIATGALIPVYLVTWNFAASTTILFGTTLAYYVYEWAHYSVHHHHFKSGIMSYLQKFHYYHHLVNPNSCFGVTNPFWDFLFKSASRKRKINLDEIKLVNKSKILFQIQKKTEQFLVLSDGRKLCYEELGNKNGYPVIYIHGTPGSRHLIHPDKNIPKKLGIRFITLDRSGFAHSDPKKNRTVLDFSVDLKELVEYLGIKKFSIYGLSAGAPYALACAHQMPDQVEHVTLVNGAVFRAFGGTISNKWAIRIAWKLSEKSPYFLIPMLWVCKQGLKYFPNFMMKALGRFLPKIDIETLKKNGQKETFFSAALEGFKHGTFATALDWHVIMKPWGFSLKEIQVPVSIWQGALDQVVSEDMARFLNKEIPNAHLFIFQNEGHSLFYTFWEKILLTTASEVNHEVSIA